MTKKITTKTRKNEDTKKNLSGAFALLNFRAFVIVFFFSLCPAVALAGSGHEHVARSCRCGTDLVRLGDSKVMVLIACGEPDRVFEVGEDRTGRRGDRHMRYSEDWIYLDLGGCVMHTFTFSGNELVKITWAKK